MSRFVNLNKREIEQLDLSGGDSIFVKGRLTNRERRIIQMAGVRMHGKPGVKGSESLDVDLNALDFEKVATYLVDWTFMDDSTPPNKVQCNRNNLERLDEDSFAEIVKVLDAWTESREKAKNSQPPDEGATVETGQEREPLRRVTVSNE
jgi:hypothetical protein